MTHGAVVAALCSVLPRFLMQWGPSPAGAGFFVAVFLVLRCGGFVEYCEAYFGTSYCDGQLRAVIVFSEASCLF